MAECGYLPRPAHLRCNVCSSQIGFSESLSAYRGRIIENVHGPLFAERTLTLYRPFLLVIALINVTDANEHMIRIVGYLRNFWTLVGAGGHNAAITMRREENKHLHANVANVTGSAKLTRAALWN
jgi:hypothetical protein